MPFSSSPARLVAALLALTAPTFVRVASAQDAAPPTTAPASEAPPAEEPVDEAAVEEEIEEETEMRAGASAACAEDDELCTGDAIVTAGRHRSSLLDTAERVDVIDRGQIERSGARDVGELLEEQPGIQITRDFRGDAIQMQGLSADYVLVLVDGMRMPGRIGGAVDLGRFGTENIERIEILRGSASALYGADAIAGVINIVTRQPTEPFEADLAVQGGWAPDTGGSADGIARVATRIGDISARLSAGYHYAEPYYFDLNPLLPREQQATAGSGRSQWSIGGDFQWRPERRLQLDARFDYLQRQLTSVDAMERNGIVDPTRIFDRTQLVEQAQASIAARWELSADTRLVTFLTYSRFREQLLSDHRTSTAEDTLDDNREDLGQLVVQADHQIGEHLLSAGIEEIFQGVDSDRLRLEYARRFRASPYVQDEWRMRLGDVGLAVVPGLRLDVDSDFGWALSPKLAVRLDPVRHLAIRASYGGGFKAPTFQQLAYDWLNDGVGYTLVGNPDLKAERSHGVQAGVEWEPIPELHGTAYFFRNDFTDMITSRTISAEPWLIGYENAATAYTMGLESALTARPIRELRLNASYTYTYGWDGEFDRRLETVARHRITGSATFSSDAWDLGATARVAVISPRVLFLEQDPENPDETTFTPWAAQVDVRVWKRFTRHFEVSVGIDNLLDTGDRYFAIRPRTFYAGLRGRY